MTRRKERMQVARSSCNKPASCNFIVKPAKRSRSDLEEAYSLLISYPHPNSNAQIFVLVFRHAMTSRSPFQMLSLYKDPSSSSSGGGGGLNRRNSMPVIHADLADLKSLGFYLETDLVNKDCVDWPQDGDKLSI